MSRPHSHIVIGCDLGQKHDPSALCVAELDVRQVGDRRETHFMIRHLERLPIGTSYPKVADRFAQVATRAHEHASEGWKRTWVTSYIDATGVGTPVVDILRERSIKGPIIAAYFTYGDRRDETFEKGAWRVSIGKAFLVSRVQALLQTHRIHLPRNHPEADALVEELLNYEIRVDENANDKYGAFKVGTHDDLVTVLGLAVQTDQPRYPIVAW